jgi:hypothetical protein
LVAIAVQEVIINILARFKLVAVLVRENTDLDLGSIAGAHGSGIKSGLAIILRVVDHLAFKEFSGINVAVVFHVLDLHALVIARVAVEAVTLKTALILVVLVICLLVVPVATLLASVAHRFLDFLLVLDGGFKVSLEVDHVLSIVVVASAARVVRAEAEDNEALGGEHSRGVFVLSKFVIVSLHELAFLELDGVSRDVDFVFFFVFVELTNLRVGSGLSSFHQVGDVGTLAIVTALGRGEGVGSSHNGCDGSNSKGEFHDVSVFKRHERGEKGNMTLWHFSCRRYIMLSRHQGMNVNVAII